MMKAENMRQNYIDCHTHTWYSHDSQCDPQSSCRQAIEKGLSGVSFTDHCDIEYADRQDIRTPILEAVREGRRCGEIFQEKLKVLTGIEIGEALWNRSEAKRILTMEQYDVVLGSVHSVRSSKSRMPFSQINFSVFTSKERKEYLNQYFEDVLEMTELCDFDVLTHLTCPLRYITGKYGIRIDLSDYQEQIHCILQKVIERNLALEVNTSGKKEKGGMWMPDREILEKYYKMGGTRITLGSDAHVAINVGNMFAETCDMLYEIGFRELYYYEARKAVPLQLQKSLLKD